MLKLAAVFALAMVGCSVAYQVAGRPVSHAMDGATWQRLERISLNRLACDRHDMRAAGARSIGELAAFCAFVDMNRPAAR